MNQTQIKKIDRIKQAAILEWVKDNDHEIKIWKVEDYGYFVSVVVEVGLKGDEGTFASLIGRNRAHIFVGPKGGLSYITKKGKKKALKFINLWEVHCAQNYQSRRLKNDK